MLFGEHFTSSFAQFAQPKEHAVQNQNEVKVAWLLRTTQAWDKSPHLPYP